MLEPVAPCPLCGEATPFDWPRCGWCGAQRLLFADGTHADHRPLAGIGRRLVASVTDLAGFAALIALVAVLPERLVAPSESPAEVYAVIFYAAVLYHCLMLGSRGQTLGKRLFGIHVVNADGSPVDHRQAAVREGVGKVVELLLAIPVGIASILSIPFDKRRQAIHDKMARTVVVRGRPVPR